MTPRTMAIIRAMTRYPAETAAVTGVLLVIIGGILSIEFNPAFHLV